MDSRWTEIGLTDSHFFLFIPKQKEKKIRNDCSCVHGGRFHQAIRITLTLNPPAVVEFKSDRISANDISQ